MLLLGGLILLLVGCTQAPSTSKVVCEISSSSGMTQSTVCNGNVTGLAKGSCEANQENELYVINATGETLIGKCPELKSGVNVKPIDGNYKITAKGTSPVAWTEIIIGTTNANDDDSEDNGPINTGGNNSEWCDRDDIRAKLSISSSLFSWSGTMQPKSDVAQTNGDCYSAYDVCTLKLTYNAKEGSNGFALFAAIDPVDVNNILLGPKAGKYSYTVDNYNWGNMTLKGLIATQPQSLGDLTQLKNLVALNRVMLMGGNETFGGDVLIPALIYFPIKRECKLVDKIGKNGTPYQVNICQPAWTAVEGNSPIESGNIEVHPCYVNLEPVENGKKGLFNGQFNCQMEAMGIKSKTVDESIDQEAYILPGSVTGTFENVCFHRDGK